MRRVAIDTETTGLEYAGHDRVIEIACVELEDTKLTGQYWHSYLNPRVRITDGALKIHGITDEFLEDKPEFIEAVEDLIDFIGDSEIVGHNYLAFDRHFLAKEFKLVGKPAMDNSVIDTLLMARAARGAKRCNLDQLCKDFKIINTREGQHGALVDADLTAKVFAHLSQTAGTIKMDFAPPENELPAIEYEGELKVVVATEHELNLHTAMCEALKIKSWQKLPRPAK